VSGDVCTICEGGGGWWQERRHTVAASGLQHCDGTGVEPDPGVMPTPTVEEYL
jgi:hypothetical protein